MTPEDEKRLAEIEDGLKSRPIRVSLGDVDWLAFQLRAERARAEKLEHLALSTAKIADEQERRAEAAERIVGQAQSDQRAAENALVSMTKTAQYFEACVTRYGDAGAVAALREANERAEKAEAALRAERARADAAERKIARVAEAAKFVEPDGSEVEWENGWAAAMESIRDELAQ